LSKAAGGALKFAVEGVTAERLPTGVWKVRCEVDSGLDDESAVERLISNQPAGSDCRNVGHCAGAGPSDPTGVVRPPLPPPTSTGSEREAATTFFDLYGDDESVPGTELRAEREWAQEGAQEAGTAAASALARQEAERARKERAARYAAQCEADRAAQQAARDAALARQLQEEEDKKFAMDLDERERTALIGAALGGLVRLKTLLKSEEMETEIKWTVGFCQSVVDSVRPVVEVAKLRRVGCAELWINEGGELRNLFGGCGDQRATDISVVLPEIERVLCGDDPADGLQVYGLYSFCALCILGRGCWKDNKELFSKEDAQSILPAIINTVDGRQAFAHELAEVLGSAWEFEESTETQNIMLALFGIGYGSCDDNEVRQDQWRKWLKSRASTINK
jgi:hypothetical protein